eukprot:5863806-Amphidinium_carterae.1
MTMGTMQNISHSPCLGRRQGLKVKETRGMCADTAICITHTTQIIDGDCHVLVTWHTQLEFLVMYCSHTSPSFAPNPWACDLILRYPPDITNSALLAILFMEKRQREATRDIRSKK